MSYIGVNIGALTVKVASLRGESRSATVLAHQGRPLEILHEVLARPEFADAEYYGVSGQLGHVSEVAAVQRAFREVDGKFDAVASLGGPTMLQGRRVVVRSRRAVGISRPGDDQPVVGRGSP